MSLSTSYITYSPTQWRIWLAVLWVALISQSHDFLLVSSPEQLSPLHLYQYSHDYALDLEVSEFWDGTVLSDECGLWTPGPLPVNLITYRSGLSPLLRVSGIATSKPEPHSQSRQKRTPSREDRVSTIRAPKFLKTGIHPGYGSLVIFSFHETENSLGYSGSLSGPHCPG